MPAPRSSGINRRMMNTNLSLLAASDGSVLVSSPAGVLGVLLAVLAVIFWMTQHPTLGRIFKVVPALVFCYFVPTTLTTFGVIPESSALYEWVKSFVLPAALLLLILALDLPGIIRLGPKAIIMMLAGTTGVVLGAPLALWIMQSYLPENAWQGMTALCGSWIGGGANFVALGKIANASDAMIATMVIPDVFVANIWMAVLLYSAGIQRKIDKWTGADASAIRDLEQRLEAFQAKVMRIPSLADLIVILALGFGLAYVSLAMAKQIDGTLERNMTVDALVITPPDDAERDASFTLAVTQQGAGLEQRTYLVAERSESNSVTLGESAAVDASRASRATLRLMLGEEGLPTIGALADAVNAAGQGWRAEVANEAYAEISSRQLREFSSRSIDDDGIQIRIPDPGVAGWWSFRESFGTTTWKFLLITTIGLVLSFTPLRRLEGAGASKVGSVMIYLLVACIGAHASFASILEQPAWIVTAGIWMSVHIIVLLTTAWLIKAPIFFVAVGSQANIGGAASAPVVASAFHPALAAVGALLAVGGYVLGTYAGLVCMWLLRAVAGA